MAKMIEIVVPGCVVMPGNIQPGQPFMLEAEDALDLVERGIAQLFERPGEEGIITVHADTLADLDDEDIEDEIDPSLFEETTSDDEVIEADIDDSPTEEKAVTIINVNTATAEEIADGLDKVGQSVGENIVAYREEHGPFANVKELVKVDGMTTNKLNANEGKVSV